MSKEELDICCTVYKQSGQLHNKLPSIVLLWMSDLASVYY